MYNKRGVLFLAGRSLNGTVGHNRTLMDFLEDADPDPGRDPNRDGGKRFESDPITTTYNDRVMVIQVQP